MGVVLRRAVRAAAWLLLLALLALPFIYDRLPARGGGGSVKPTDLMAKAIVEVNVSKQLLLSALNTEEPEADINKLSLEAANTSAKLREYASTLPSGEGFYTVLRRAALSYAALASSASHTLKAVEALGRAAPLAVKALSRLERCDVDGFTSYYEEARPYLLNALSALVGAYSEASKANTSALLSEQHRSIADGYTDTLASTVYTLKALDKLYTVAVEEGDALRMLCSGGKLSPGEAAGIAGKLESIKMGVANARLPLALADTISALLGKLSQQAMTQRAGAGASSRGGGGSGAGRGYPSSSD